MALQRNRSGRGGRYEVHVGLNQLRCVDDDKSSGVHLISVGMFDRRARVVTVLVVIHAVVMIRVLIMVIVTVTLMIGFEYGDFGEGQLGGAVPSIIVVDMLTAES